MASTQYQVTITMSPATVNALTEGGFTLNGFKAVRVMSGGGAPLVWFQTRSFSTDTVLTWTDGYQAYTSQTPIKPDARIVVRDAYWISPDETLNVLQPDGTGSVARGGVPQAISIVNQTSRLFTGGISQRQPGGTDGPICASKLFDGELVVIAPVEKVLLMFTTAPVQPGTVVDQAPGQGILIDLTGAPSRSVAYDVNGGWSWDGGDWASIVGANDKLIPILIDASGATTAP